MAAALDRVPRSDPPQARSAAPCDPDGPGREDHPDQDIAAGHTPFAAKIIKDAVNQGVPAGAEIDRVADAFERLDAKEIMDTVGKRTQKQGGQDDNLPHVPRQMPAQCLEDASVRIAR